MAPLALILLCLTVVLLLLRAPRLGGHSRTLLSGYTLVLVLLIVYIAFPSLLAFANDYQFVWVPVEGSSSIVAEVDVIAIVGALVFTVTYRLTSLPRFRRDRRRSHLANEQEANLGGLDTETSTPLRDASSSGATDNRWLAYTLIVVGCALKLYVIRNNGGIFGTAARLSGSISGYTASSPLSSSAIGIRTISGIADAGATWLVLAALRGRTPLRLRLAIWFGVLFLSYFTVGKRLILLLPLLGVALGIHRYRREISIKLVPVLLLAGFGFGMATLLFRVIAPGEVTGIQVDVRGSQYANGSVLNYYVHSLEFSPVEAISAVVRDRDIVLDQYRSASNAFFSTNIEPLGYAVPHQFWQGKPSYFSDVSYAVGAYSTGRSLDSAPGYIITIIGSGYVFGGTVGVIVGMGLLGFFCARSDLYASRSSRSLRSVVAFAFLLNIAFQLFRQGTIGWAFTNGVIQQLGMLVGFVALSVLASSRAPKRAAVVGRSAPAHRTKGAARPRSSTTAPASVSVLEASPVATSASYRSNVMPRPVVVDEREILAALSPPHAADVPLRRTAPLDDSPLRAVADRSGVLPTIWLRAISLSLGFVANVIIIRLLVKMGGPAQYAVFALIMSLLAWLPFADLGLGAGIINDTADLDGGRMGRATYVKKFRRTARTLLIVAFSVVIVATVIYLATSWRFLLGTLASSRFGPEGVLFAFVLVALSIPLGLAGRVLQGLGKAEVGAAWGLLAAPLQLAAVYVCYALHLPVAVCACACAAALWLVNPLVAISARTRLRPVLAASPEGDGSEPAPLFGTAFPYLVTLLGATLSVQLDRVILAHVGSASDVAEYSLLAQFVVPALSVIVLGSQNLWPRYRHQLSRGELSQSQLVRHVVAFGLFGLAATLVIGLFLRVAGGFITGHTITVTFTCLMWGGAYLLLSSIGRPISMLLSDSEGLWWQAVASIVGGVVSLSLTVYLGARWGASGAFAATALAVAATQTVPLLYRTRAVLRTQTSSSGSVAHRT